MTAAERKAKSRAKLRAEMGEDAYKKKHAKDERIRVHKKAEKQKQIDALAKAAPGLAMAAIESAAAILSAGDRARRENNKITSKNIRAAYKGTRKIIDQAHKGTRKSIDEANKETTKSIRKIDKRSRKADAINQKLAADHMLKILETGCSPNAEEIEEEEAKIPLEEVEDVLVAEIEEESETEVSPNAGYLPGKGIPIVLPLTHDENIIFVNMDEDPCLTTIVNNVIHMLIEQNLPGVEKGAYLHSTLKQIQADLPVDLYRAIDNLNKGRGMVQHKKWLCKLRDPYEYERKARFVLRMLAPNWQLEHRNAAAQEWRDYAYDLEDQLARVQAELRRCKAGGSKRPRDGDERDEYGDEDRYQKRYRRDDYGTRFAETC